MYCLRVCVRALCARARVCEISHGSQEIGVHQSTDYERAPISDPGDDVRAKALVQEVFCLARCVGKGPPPTPTSRSGW